MTGISNYARDLLSVTVYTHFVDAYLAPDYAAILYSVLHMQCILNES